VFPAPCMPIARELYSKLECTPPEHRLEVDRLSRHLGPRRTTATAEGMPSLKEF
jgi:hypothetical protein